MHVKVREGEKERIQLFAGVVIARRGGGVRETFTVRKISGGIGVERIFPLHSPIIDRIEVERKGAVRRAKLYYLRDRKGKAARIDEKQTGLSGRAAPDRDPRPARRTLRGAGPPAGSDAARVGARRAAGIARIAGVDEVGRGSLAGPVVAAAVILPAGCVLPGLDDSKRVDAEARERASIAEIRASRARDRRRRRSRPARSTRGDILRASLEAMRRAVTSLAPAPDALLVDAVRVPGVAPAAAGRRPRRRALRLDRGGVDRGQGPPRRPPRRLSARGYPAYGFEQHKGYGTPEHWEALRRYGPCPEHRLTLPRGRCRRPAPTANRRARRRAGRG